MSRLGKELQYQNLLRMSEEKLCSFLPDARVSGATKNQIGSILIGRSNVSIRSLYLVAEYCSSQKLVRMVEEKLAVLGVTL